MTSARRFSRPAVLFAALYLAGCLDVDPPTQPGPPDVFLAVPEGWLANYGDFAGVGLSKAHAHSGTTAAYISGQGTAPVQATMMQFIQAEQYVGKRVRYSAWLKPQKIEGTLSGIWMRVDVAEHTVAFDNMATRPVLGTGDWRQVSIVLDVPANAVALVLVPCLPGRGHWCWMT